LRIDGMRATLFGNEARKQLEVHDHRTGGIARGSRVFIPFYRRNHLGSGWFVAQDTGGAIIGPHAVNGISHAFLAGAGLAVLASLIALTTLPRASTFLHKLRLAPAMPMH